MRTMDDEYDNTVFVGGKDIGNYVGAVLTQLEEFDEVFIRARGQANIGKAVVVSEMMQDKYGKDADIETRTDIKPDTGDAVTAVEITVSE